MSELTAPPEQPSKELLARPLATLMTLDWERIMYVVFVVLAVITRFYDVGSRVMSHDESLHTQFSYQYYDGQGYVHTPLMHGPFLFHATALAYWLFGPGDFTSRVPVAILGVLLVFMPYFLRSWLGRVGALFTSFFFLISPYLSYYSRYIRHDIYVITWAMIVFIAMWYYFRDRKERYLWWFAAGTALMFSTKEVSFIYVAIFGSMLVIRLLARLATADWLRQTLPNLRLGLLVLIAGVLLVSVGLVGDRLVSRQVEAPGTVEATTEGFAADPNAASPTAGIGSGSSAETALGWLTVAGIGVAGLGLFLGARKLRPGLDSFGEFDLIVLFSTLLLPFIAPLFSTIVGWDPLDYSFNTCILQGQESMSSIQVFLARLTNATCWTSALSSGIAKSAFWVVLLLGIAIAVGFWWNRRKWLIAAAVFNAIILVLYTSIFTNPGGWASGVVGSLGYWLVQQEVQRGSQPWFYYLFVTPFYEFLVTIFALAGIYLWTRRRRLNEIVVQAVVTLLLAVLGFSFVNWLYNGRLDIAQLQNASVLPGAFTAVAILIGSLLLWFGYRRRRIVEKYDLTRGLSELFDPRALLEFTPFLAWWLLLTVVAYSVAGEKMPWLSTHFVIPMAMLSGWYFNEKLRDLTAVELFSRRALLLLGLTIVLIVAALLAFGPLILGQIAFGSQTAESLRATGRFLGGILAVGVIGYFWWQQYHALGRGPLRSAVNVLSAFVLLAVLTIRFAYMANFPNADYTNEFSVYAHGAPATKSVVMEQVDELSMRLHGDKSMRVAFDSDVSWPFTWYLRDYPNRNFFGDNPGQNLNESPVVIVGSRNWDKVEPYLSNNYTMTEHTFLWWPMEEYRKFSWNALLGDPRVPATERRGIFNPGVRQALWDIFMYRNYQKYGEVFGGTYTAGEWPLRHDLRLYIRNDVAATIWDYGVGATVATAVTDPYAEGAIAAAPVLSLNTAGVAGSAPGELTAPRNVAIAPDGQIFVADSGNNRIQVFDADGQPLTSFGETGAGDGQFNEPWGIAVDDEFVYVADTWNHRIQKFTRDGRFVAAFGRSGSAAESADGGLGLFFGPRSVVLLDDNRLLVTDTGNHRMQILDRDGNFLEQIGGFGSNLGQMNEPVGLSRAPNGSVFLADTWNGRIQEFLPDMVPINTWQVDAWTGTSINNKPFTAVDSAGRVYVTDPEGYRVLIFSPNGDYIGRFGTFGSDVGSLGLPNGIAIDANDFVYIADAGNNRILKFAPLFPAVQAPFEESIDEAGAPPIDEAASDESYPAAEENKPAPTEAPQE